MDHYYIGKRIGKIYTAEILELINVFLSFVLIIFTALAVFSLGGSGIGLVIGGSLAVIVGLAITVMSVVSLILIISGTAGLKNVSSNFNKAFICVIICLIGAVIAGIATFISAYAANIINTVTNAITILATVFIIEGIIEVFRLRGDVEEAEKAKGVERTIAVLFIISWTLNFFSLIGARSGVFGTILSLAAVILTIIVYFKYLSLLSKAKRILMTN